MQVLLVHLATRSHDHRLRYPIPNLNATETRWPSADRQLLRAALRLRQRGRSCIREQRRPASPQLRHDRPITPRQLLKSASDSPIRIGQQDPLQGTRWCFQPGFKPVAIEKRHAV